MEAEGRDSPPVYADCSPLGKKTGPGAEGDDSWSGYEKSAQITFFF